MTSSQLTSYSMMKTESFSSKIRNKTSMPTPLSSLLFNMVPVILVRANRQEKNKTKGIQIRKKK